MSDQNHFEQDALPASIPHQQPLAAGQYVSHEGNNNNLSRIDKGPIEQILSSRRSVRHTESETSPKLLSNNKSVDYFTKHQHVVFRGHVSAVC